MLSIGERRYVVVGHRMTRDGELVGPGYVVVPYPLGFVDADSLQVVPASEVGAVVGEGYVSDASDAYLSDFSALAEANSAIAYDEYVASARLLRDFAREEAQKGS